MGYSPRGRKESDTTERLHFQHKNMGFPGGAEVKNPPANAGDTSDSGSIPGSGRSLEKEMATHSSILA